jgi:DNA (cytosine-5)-methyltransferase 1
MIFGSLFSGIEAASVVWRPLGWRCAWVAEIDPFACAVLRHRYPDVPNLGDVNRIDPDAIEPVDLVVFGSPCQSFSVAGKRLGLDDPRGNMALVGLRVVGKLRPRWVVWENVPGVLSSDGGRDFGAFLGLLGELGYGFAYRVLDAQHFGVPQRRRRVFVVASLGDWRGAAAVLFEPESLRGDSPPRREAGQNAPAKSLCSTDGGIDREDRHTLIAIAHTLRADGFDAGEDGTGRGTLLTLAIRGRGDSHDLEWRDDGIANAILTPNGGRAGIGVGAIAFDPTARQPEWSINRPLKTDGSLAVAFHENQRAETTLSDTAGALKVGGGKPGQGYAATLQAMSVRRLMPVETERLQGFPDNWTNVTYRGKPAADGPRYRAIGNSMAVPVVGWIGERIQAFEDLAVVFEEAAE